MTKNLVVILALAFLLSVTSFAYAEVQNVKISGDILMQGVSRRKFALKDAEFDGASKNKHATDSFLLSTMRVRLDADLTDNVSATVRLLNERIWGQEDTYADNSQMGMDLAYITLKEFLYSPLSLAVGRQELRFGNGLIIGDPDTNMTYLDNNPAGTVDISARDLSARKAFDAIRATFDYNPLTVDVIYSKIDENNVARKDDIDLYGVNAAYDFGVNNTIGEAYLFVKKDQYANSKTEKINVLGVRVESEVVENLTANAEIAHQFGKYQRTESGASGQDKQSVERDAWALQLGVDYLLANVQCTPSIGLGYTYLSGEKDNRKAGKYEGWDPMFEDQDAGTIYNAILVATNYHLINLRGSIKPIEDVTASLSYSHLIVDKKYGNGLDGNGSNQQQQLDGVDIGPVYKMTNNSHLGDEIDLGLTYDYTEDVQFGLNAGVFIPGDALHRDNNRNATQVIGSMKVSF